MHTAHIYYDDDNKPHMILLGGRSKDELSNGIYKLDLDELQWSRIGDMPSIICSHASVLVQNRYIVVYGGFNGTAIFDSIRRYDIKENKWLTYTNPTISNECAFFSDGRIATAMENANDEIVLLFGGSSALKDHNDTFCIKVEDLVNDDYFSEITLVL